MVFQAYQGQMACRECQAFRGRKVLRKEKEPKDRLVTRAHKECGAEEGTEGPKGRGGRVEHQE